MIDILNKFEDGYGALSSYSASVALAGAGMWLANNWFLALSAVAVVIRIAVDLKKLFKKSSDNG